MAATFGAGSDGPLLMQQQPADPSRSMLAQVLANAQNMPAPRTGNAAMMQTLAQVLAGGGNAWMAGQDRRDQEEAGDIISGLITGKPPEPKPSFIQRAANFVGLGDDKAPSTPAAEPRSRQFAQLIAEGGQPDQTPSVGMPPVVSPDSGAPLPSPVAAPAAGPTGTPLSAKEQLARALASSNPRVKAWAMNRALAIQDAETKRDAELDKEYATKGLRRNPDGSVARITGYGTGVGENEADKFRALTPAEIAREEEKKRLNLRYDPQIEGAKTEAQTAPLLARRESEKGQDLRLNPQIEAATTDARNRADLRTAEPRAAATSRGTVIGAASGNLSPLSPEQTAAIGLPPNVPRTVGAATAFTHEAGTAGGRGPTDQQRVAAGFGTRMEAANKIAADIESKIVGGGYDPSAAGQVNKLPVVGNILAGPEGQRYRQAAEDFISANLRKESGAALTTDERAAEFQKYFPQPGDKWPVIKQKAEARARVIGIMSDQSGGHFKPAAPATAPAPAAPAAPGPLVIPNQRGAQSAPVTATGPNGQRIMLQDGQWVPAQ